MIDPIIFQIHIGTFTFAWRWYGLILVVAIALATWVMAGEMRRRGGKSEQVWECMIWGVIAGIIGARIWFVVADILGGNTRYLENPVSILNTTAGGLHFFGAMLFGGLAFYVYARRHNVDTWMLLDSAAPAVFIGQLLHRPANFINQELYGQPTDLPWGIPIQASQRIPPWNDLARFPEGTTRFHPTFAYEMIWDAFAAGLLLGIAHRFEDKMKPGAVFFGWLVLAGVGRFIIEWFRPDQPRVPGTDISFTRIVAALMAAVGTVLLLNRYRVIRVPFLAPGPEAYTLPPEETPETEGQEA